MLYLCIYFTYLFTYVTEVANEKSSRNSVGYIRSVSMKPEFAYR